MAPRVAARGVIAARLGGVADEPIGYLITFRSYGTWLPGDGRGWTAWGSAFPQPAHAGHPGLEADQRARMRGEPVVLGSEERACVAESIRETCAALGWRLHALNVRTNHVHGVVSGAAGPERMMTTIKAWATRGLRASGLIADGLPVWSRHGSTAYLWNEEELERACEYVLNGQD